MKIEVIDLFTAVMWEVLEDKCFIFDLNEKLMMICFPIKK